MNEHDQNEELQVPAKFADALRDLQKERVFVPQQVDARILAEARAHLRQNKSKIVLLPRLIAVAAAFILLCAIAYVFLPHGTATKTFAAEDINHDGEVNILDAYALARKVESGTPVNADFNQDGHVDKADAEAIATDVVKLEKGGAS